MADPTLLAELRRDEGVVRHGYHDSEGYLTIGVGRLIDERLGGGLSDREIDYLLANDVEKVDAELDVHVPWWRGMDPVRRRVLQNMMFNMGWPRLSGFAKALAAMKAGRYAAAAAEMLDSKWARQTGDRATRLAKMMRTGSA